MSESVLNFLEGKNLPKVTKKKHTYLMMDGHDQEDIYVLKDGVVKVSIILCDGREFNITYLKGLDMISLLKDEIDKMTTHHFMLELKAIRQLSIESTENYLHNMWKKVKNYRHILTRIIVKR